MTQIKEELRVSHNRGLTVLIVFKDGILCDAVALTKRLLQQQIRQHTEPLTLFIFELQRLFATLLGNII